MSSICHLPLGAGTAPHIGIMLHTPDADPNADTDDTDRQASHRHADWSCRIWLLLIRDKDVGVRLAFPVNGVLAAHHPAVAARPTVDFDPTPIFVVAQHLPPVKARLAVYPALLVAAA